MRVGRRFIVRGRVQGVGFRFFAVDSAQREGVTGYATNWHDGRVEIVTEGETEAVDRFERSMRQGPRGARIDDVETEVLTPGQRFVGFEIRG